jgi:hypothetical protein
MNRTEHLQWAKDRANEYVKQGDTTNAYASMVSDLGKHPETEGHNAISLGMTMMMSGLLSSQAEMKNFIDGFN